MPIGPDHAALMVATFLAIGFQRRIFSPPLCGGQPQRNTSRADAFATFRQEQRLRCYMQCFAFHALVDRERDGASTTDGDVLRSRRLQARWPRSILYLVKSPCPPDGREGNREGTEWPGNDTHKWPWSSGISQIWRTKPRTALAGRIP